ncbi:MAG: copper transporter [Jatrophihabitantaceae bacterium]
MISFRYHIVSIVAVFLALALGVVVGTTVLNGPVTNDLRKQVSGLNTDKSNLSGQVNDLQSQVNGAGQFAAAFGGQVVQNKLKDKKVLIIALPGASAASQAAIAAEIKAGGAQLTGQFVLSNDYVDPSSSSDINTLVTGSHPMALTLPSTSDGRQLGAAVLSYVLVGGGEPTDLTTVLSGFSSLHLTTSDPTTISPAKTIVVIGDGPTPADGYAGQADLDLITALQAQGAKIVVAGDGAAATANGIVGLVRASGVRATVSTVDDATSAFGPISTVLALAEVVNSRVGHYGTAKGADAPFPNLTS